MLTDKQKKKDGISVKKHKKILHTLAFVMAAAIILTDIFGNISMFMVHAEDTIMEATENQENPVIQDAEDEEAAGEVPERDGAGNSDVWESLPDDQKTETVSNGTTDAETVTETEPESETETESEGRMETETETESESETETETETELCAQTRASSLTGGMPVW